MGNQIRDLRKVRGWSIRELAERMSVEGQEVHFTTVAKIERSQRQLTAQWAKRFAEALGVTPAEISSDFDMLAGPQQARQVPVIGLVAAGNWREAVQETERYIAALAEGRNTFGLTVAGRSMDQIAPEGSTVMVDPDRLELHDGGFYVVMNGDGEATFKRYRSNPARLEPCSSDTSYSTIVLGSEAFTIVGRVVGVYQQL